MSVIARIRAAARHSGTMNLIAASCRLWGIVPLVELPPSWRQLKPIPKPFYLQALRRSDSKTGLHTG
jgi:hypothetical protein